MRRGAGSGVAARRRPARAGVVADHRDRAGAGVGEAGSPAAGIDLDRAGVLGIARPGTCRTCHVFHHTVSTCCHTPDGFLRRSTFDRVTNMTSGVVRGAANAFRRRADTFPSNSGNLVRGPASAVDRAVNGLAEIINRAGHPRYRVVPAALN